MEFNKELVIAQNMSVKNLATDDHLITQSLVVENEQSKCSSTDNIVLSVKSRKRKKKLLSDDFQSVFHKNEGSKKSFSTSKKVRPESTNDSRTSKNKNRSRNKIKKDVKNSDNQGLVSNYNLNTFSLNLYVLFSLERFF